MPQARLIDAVAVSDDWWLIRLHWHTFPAPGIGQWLWLTLAGHRVCLPIRDSDATEGWVAGIIPGAQLDQQLLPGQSIDIEGPHGKPIRLETTARLILLGEDSGIAPAMALAERHSGPIQLVILGGQYGVPARLAPSRFYIAELAQCAIAGASPLEQHGIASRIALSQERPGVFEGTPAMLLGRYLCELSPTQRASVHLVALTPWGQLEALKRGLAADLGHFTGIELPPSA